MMMMILLSCYRTLLVVLVLVALSTALLAPRLPITRQSLSGRTGSLFGQTYPNFYNDFEGYNDDSSNNANDDDEDDDEDDDDDIDDLLLTTSQMDWRTFRRNLATMEAQGGSSGTTSSISNSESTTAQISSQSSASPSSASSKKQHRPPSICHENQDLLRGQSKGLYDEFNSVWAHVTATPEVGGLVARMPLEVEMQRNYKHSITGARLRREYKNNNDATSSSSSDDETASMEVWYKRAQSLIEKDLTYLTEQAAQNDGQIDATTLSDDMAEMLQLYLDHQDSWQEVCLVLEQDGAKSTTLVLNRPMAMQLTENLGQLVLLGAFSPVSSSTSAARRRNRPDLNRFMKAFGSECAVYIGGPDDQDQPAELIHGIATLPGAREIAPNTGIYRGGLLAAVEGVLRGDYKPLDFRFFVGRHRYNGGCGSSSSSDADIDDDDDDAGLADASLDLSILLGKYQPIAAARAVALKQCISLPKPLWHEVLELCGGEMHQISHLELEKRDDLQIQIVDDEDEDEEIIIDELDVLSRFDDDDEDDDDEDDDDDRYYYGGRR